eukprot:TRINITY_DN5047_c0_g1_i2.p1 TRINITY_DN5047_c0_g1~~TRINITY_DN5047_c0_g1_i2.p1  ORF type:complete len:737 (-),score=56.20 TRINITY_DN5047_c0_g1_i2:199-2409(-)
MMRYVTLLFIFFIVEAKGSYASCEDEQGTPISHGMTTCGAQELMWKCIDGNLTHLGTCGIEEAYCSDMGLNSYLLAPGSSINVLRLRYCCHHIKMFDCAEVPASLWVMLLTTGVAAVVIGLGCSCLSLFYKPDLRARHHDVSPVTDAESASWGDGFSMHERVPMHRWCVSREDLLNFKKLVQEAVAAEKIVPTEMDGFDPRDMYVGPSMYTVNEQYIKPVTAAAGKMSWALMLHPDGLDCDMFISHGWKEGVYEFVDSVVCSWPRGVHAAYFCVLSNPQNLDISSLISSPDQSPFAQALRASRCVLAVPNHCESIYARLWCSYEAYLAYILDKPLYTAFAPIPDVAVRMGHCVGLYLISFGLVLILATILCDFPIAPWRYLSLVNQMLGISLFVFHFFARLKLDPEAYGLKVFSLFACCSFGVSWSVECMLMPLYVITGAIGLIIFLTFGASFEASRLLAVNAKQQAAKLSVGFTGQVCDAQCSREEDAIHIKSEIREKASDDEVDSAVSVLVEMGMSTSYLRELEDEVGSLGSQTAWSFSTLLAFPATFIGLPLLLMDVQTLWLNPFLWICVAEGVACILVFLLLPRDRTKFAVGVAGSIAGVCLVSVFINITTVSFIHLRASEFEDNAWSFGFVMPLIGGPVALACSVAGPLRIACIPFAGRIIVRAMCGKPFIWDRFHSIVKRFRKPVRKLALQTKMLKLRKAMGKPPPASSGTAATLPPFQKAGGAGAMDTE